MIAFFKPRALFSGTAKFRDNNISLSTVQNNSQHSNYITNNTNAVVVFSHHRDVKVALDELSDAGLSNDYMTLITRHAQRCLWNSELAIDSCFNTQRFAFNQVAQEFFRRLFQRGKYLVLITGSKQDVNVASKIMSRRRDHAEVWFFE